MLSCYIMTFVRIYAHMSTGYTPAVCGVARKQLSVSCLLMRVADIQHRVDYFTLNITVMGTRK